MGSMTTPGGHNSAITWDPYVRVAWGGQLGTSAEIWTNSLKWKYAAAGTVPGINDLETMMDTVIPLLSTWFSGAAAGISFNAHMNWIKCNYVLASGLQMRSDTQSREFPVVNGGIGGSQEAAFVSFSTTYALTLRTEKARGRAHSGRIFPPMVTFQPEPDGYCTAGVATAAATSFGTFLSQANAAISASGPNPGTFHVLSPGNTTKGQAPLNQIITGVVMDRVPDTQHRRTNRLTRSEGALAPVTF